MCDMVGYLIKSILLLQIGVEFARIINLFKLDYSYLIFIQNEDLCERNKSSGNVKVKMSCLLYYLSHGFYISDL